MRAFVAIPLPRPLREELAAYATGAVRGLDARALPAENLHATVHFLGAVDDAATEPLLAALHTACAAVAPFALRVAGAAFAPPSRPRMIWAQLEAPAELAELARSVGAACEPFAPDARPPRTARPHVTLARLRRRPPRAAELPPLEVTTPDVAVDECALVRSELGRGGSRYTTLARLPLAG